MIIRLQERRCETENLNISPPASRMCCSVAGAICSNPLVQAEIEEAARLANAHSFICSLPHGYATQVDMPGCCKVAVYGFFMH